MPWLLGPNEVETSAAENEDDLDDALAEALEEDEDDAGEARPADTWEPRRRRRGRRKLPEALPRVEVEVLPPEVLLEGLSNFERIGEVVSETV